ncbi:MAG: hypothetical protein BWY79_01419 [Actinobacteria bacterium ADurb.Bin444]|nr:MAG: hypothetical protein BWY79_01419 [Actinobacteria bacterium ADurb.Bin444]
MRVRLFGHPSVQGSALSRLRDRAGQLQPGHHHDRSGDGRRHLHRTAERGDARGDHSAGTARRPAAQPGRSVRPQPVVGAGARRRPGAIRSEHHRYQGRHHRAGRRPSGLQADHVPVGHRNPAQRDLLHGGGVRTRGGCTRLSRGHPPRLHHGRHRRWSGLQQGRAADRGRTRHPRQSGGASAGGGVGGGVGGVGS